ncbi:class I SAM-dependent methyltransferase [Paracrocinitomix mangrovi]|uniref:class I SAM-dependent methyltransferase n=1 Tax=Paracrocinitomix mangrovi TaxID=2862509 RepID=UPI001C8D3BA2|nr:class I SAM-dependent methyltransferase [Paracrocinitomix mangrovi]UKN00237.1 class I SAM-dependent methyltransferase [Paracrocinitomix mangrovi]
MEDNYSETHKTWDKLAQLYEEKFMELDLYDDTYQKFCDLLTSTNASVLEIGCGPGNITRQILNINPMLNVLATDVSKNMVELAQKNNPNAKVQVLDGRDLNTLKSQFDGVVCGFIIPYLSENDTSTLIKNCSKTLYDKGVFYLSFVEGNPAKSGFITGATGDRSYFHYYEFNTIKQLLNLNGLSIAEHYGKQFKKTDNSIENHTIILARKD